MTHPPLVLTGGPAAGKSVTSQRLAATRPRCAIIDVDDVRQLVVSGAAAPWQGQEGVRQQRLGVTNSCAMARNFLAADFEVIVADVLTRETAELYRRELPGCVIVHLVVSRTEAVRRAATRAAWLTEDEFHALHDADDGQPPDADIRLPVDDLDVAGQADAVAARWAT